MQITIFITFKAAIIFDNFTNKKIDYYHVKKPLK